MSRSLGPIHYLMYEKIKRQDEYTAALLEKDAAFAAALERAMPAVSTRPLDELIDQENIHGWLAAAVDRVEIRFAAALKHLGVQAAENVMERLGRRASEGKTAAGPQALFEFVNAALLDGMPCDNALSAHDDGGDLVLHQAVAVHDAPMTAPLGELDPADSLDKLCGGGHDHDHHESFELSPQALQAAEAAGAAEDFYRARLALLRGLAEPLGWRVTRDGRDFRFHKVS